MITVKVARSWLKERAKYIETQNLKKHKEPISLKFILDHLNECFVRYCNYGCSEIDFYKYREIRNSFLKGNIKEDTAE